MNTDPKPTAAERERLEADRLCYLAEGAEGLRTRHGLQQADRTYRDEYDAQAKQQRQASRE